jgi:hypothetical protein
LGTLEGVRASMTTVRELRESAEYYRNGRQAARVATAYAGLVLLATVVVVFRELALSGGGAGTIALLVATLPGSLAVLVVMAALGGLPDSPGAMASGVSLVQIGILAGAGLAQSWVLWRVGRGPRLW